MNRSSRTLLGFVAVAAVVAAIVLTGRSDRPPLQAESSVDLDRYLGTWYVIANIPYFAEAGNVASRAVYRARDDGRIDDLYFYREDFDGEEQSMAGVAWIIDEASNARWNVRFFWPLTFDYVILDLDEDYRHVAVGHPSRNYGWVMAREPRIDADQYERLMAVFAANGYDTAEFLKVPQFPEQLGQPGFQ